MKRSSEMKRFGVRISILLVAVALAASRAFAADAGVELHATILARVLSNELTLEERAGDDIGIAVVYRPGDGVSETSAGEWMKALDALSSVRIKAKRVFAIRVPNDPEQLARAVEKSGIDVVLAAEGLGSETNTLASFARSHHILSIGSNTSYVERDLTLCVYEENERTRIFINLTNASSEGIRFSSNVLKLAKLVR